jgi:hypothetical protein
MNTLPQATEGLLLSAGERDAPRVVVAPSVTALDQSLYVHKDLVQVVKPWEVEQHLGPPKASEQFGSLDSWVDYVKRYVPSHVATSALLTWNAVGFVAVIDYHTSLDEPGRRQWTAAYQLPFSPQYRDWIAFANGHARGQREVVEKLEDLGTDVDDPKFSQADLLGLLRDMRVNTSAESESSIDESGGYEVQWIRKENVRSARGGKVMLPPTFRIVIPFLKGHYDGRDEQGRLRAMLYPLTVRLRAMPDAEGRLALRLSLPDLDRRLEQMLSDLVAEAEKLLGDGYTLLRAAG